MSELRVFDCPSCGAALPAAADGAHITCPFCKNATVIDYSGASMVREKQSRQEAEALFATLGQPPTWSQRFAVVLTNGWLWLFGLPFMFALVLRVSQLPHRAIDALWESTHHERLAHVINPVAGAFLDVGWPAGLILFLLVWSLFGERIDARRDLQAALASKPPKTKGGPSRCRNCDGALAVADGALGARCSFCGADNLLQVPPAWAKRAKRIDAKLRLSTDVARQRSQEGARRVRKAAMWRAPFFLAVLAISLLPAWGLRGRASWDTMRYHADARVGVYWLAIRQEHEMPSSKLRSFAACDDAQARNNLLADATLSTDATQMFDPAMGHYGVAMMPLSHGERLRLAWKSAKHGALRVALGDRSFAGGVAVLWDGFGEEIAPTKIDDDTTEYPIAISGWYKVQVLGDEGEVIEPCVGKAR